MKQRLFLYVKALSDFGMFMDNIVLNVVVFAATGSPTWLAATMAARTFGGVLASLFSGVLADRYSRRKIMIWSDIARGVLILMLIPFPEPVIIIVASFLIGLINSFFTVSFQSEIPQIFGEDKILETNSLIARLTSISLVGGFIGAGLITDMLGYEATLTIDASTYLLSAAVLMKLKWKSSNSSSTKLLGGIKEKIRSIAFDLKEVYLYVKLAPLLLMLNIVFLVGAFAGSSHNLGIPLLAESIDETRQTFYYGFIWGVWGIGSVIATYTLPKLKWLTNSRLYIAAFLSAILMSTGFIIFLSNTNVWIIFLFAFFTGIFDACFTTLHSTILQKSDNHIRGRIFGVGMLLKSFGFALGFIVAPVLLEHLAMPQMVWILHGLLIVTTITVCIIMNMYVVNKQKSVQEHF
ncbi:MFS transporter [Fredinandcohnia humi]